MSLFRTLSVAAVSAVLCGLLSVRVSATPFPSATKCTPLLGDPDINDYPVTLSTGMTGIDAVGFFTSPDIIDPAFTQFIFEYQVPDQSGLDPTNPPSQTPNDLRFAVYTNPTDGSMPQLVAQSDVATIQPVAGNQTFVVKVDIANSVTQIQPKTDYLLAILNQYTYYQFVAYGAKQLNEIAYAYSTVFPDELDIAFEEFNDFFPVVYLGCYGQVIGDPVFTGFNGEKFLVKGQADRIYNVLSLPSLQLNTRFIELTAGQAMNRTEQSSVRQRQSKMIAALKAHKQIGAGGGNRLPSTTSWSHDGMYMGETGVQVAGHKLLVKPGAYAAGFESVELDGAELLISSEAVRLLDGSSIVRSSSSVVEVTSAEVMFTLVNSDHFLNIQSTVLTAKNIEHVDGLLGQTVSPDFHVERTAAFTQHVENDFLLPAGADVWSTEFEHNQYVAPANAN